MLTTYNSESESSLPNSPVKNADRRELVCEITFISRLVYEDYSNVLKLLIT